MDDVLVGDALALLRLLHPSACSLSKYIYMREIGQSAKGGGLWTSRRMDS